MLRVTWLVVAHDLLEYRPKDDVKGIWNLVFFAVFFNMARGYENVGEIISNSAGVILQKILAGAIYKGGKWRIGDKKRTWQLVENS